MNKMIIFVKSFSRTFALVVAIGCITYVTTVEEIMKRDESVVRITADKNALSITETLNVIETGIVGLLQYRLSAMPID